MTRATFALTLFAVFALAATAFAEEVDTPSDPAASDYERALIEAETTFLERKVAAHERYVQAIVDAKRSAIDAGELDKAGRLEEQEQAVRARLEADGEALAAKRHELLSPAVVALSGEGFRLKSLRVGATAYSNRDYKWRYVPKKIQGWRFTQIDGGDTPAIRVEALRPGIVYALAEGSELKEDGWIPDADLRFEWYPDRHPMIVYGKAVEAGDVLEISHYGWTGTLVLLPPGAIASEP